jgi:hypothetical protein
MSSAILTLKQRVVMPSVNVPNVAAPYIHLGDEAFEDFRVLMLVPGDVDERLLRLGENVLESI